MKSYTHLLFTKANGIASLKLNNPQKMNAFSKELTEEIQDLLGNLKNDTSIKILKISSTNTEFFSAGADIDWFMSISGAEAEKISRMSHEIFSILETLPFPVISIVKGLCLTAGLEFILCSDLIYAADNAKFGQIEVKYGITPGGGGTQRLCRLIGPLHTRELVYTGKQIDAKEAQRIGLVNRVFPLDQIDKEVDSIIKQILQNSAEAIAKTKTLINHAYFVSEEGFKQEETVFGDRFASGEPKIRLGYVKKKIQKKKSK